MATSSMTRASGLSTFPNYLSASPTGALLEAKNVIIDRDGIIEPRRGIKVLGESYDIPKQLLTFKNNILVHSNDVIQFSDGNDPAIFTSFKGKKDFSTLSVDVLNNTITINLHGLTNEDAVVFSTTGTLPVPLVAATVYYVKNATQNTFQLSSTPGGLTIDLTTQGTGVNTINYDYVFDELQAGLRIKYIELNGNLFITTANGMKKITTNSEYAVTDAGTPKALDLSLQLDLSTSIGFLGDQKETAYRVLWGTKDINDNLLLGVPSYRQVIQNFTGAGRNVFVTFSVPEGITTDYFYQIYRTNVAVIDGSGDEMKLVYESPYTGGSTITVLDEQPEDIRDNGIPLYSNEFSGEGAFQTNNPPPIAKDVSIYRSTAFYANTQTGHKTGFTLVGLDGLEHAAQILTITGAFPATVQTTFNHNLTTGSRVLLDGAGAINGKYTITVTGADTFTINADSADYTPAVTDFPVVYSAYIKIEKNSVVNEYFFVGQPEDYTVVYKSKDVIAPGSYFLLNSYDAQIKYVFWYDITGTDPQPILTLPEGIDRVFIRIDLSTLGVKDFLPANVDIALDQITIASHGFANNQIVTLETTGTLPAPLAPATNYYLVGVTTNTLQVSATLAGPAINITTTGTGTFKISSPSSVTTTKVAEVTSDILVNTGDFTATAFGTIDFIFLTNNGAASTTGYPSGQNGITPGLTSIVTNHTGTGEDVAKQYVRKSGLISPAAAIQDTAQSLTKVINLNVNEGVYAYYTATATDLPGAIDLESRTKDAIPFTITAIQMGVDTVTNAPITAAMFNPDLRTPLTSVNESNPNKIFFSKIQQPEAVPLVNSITIGPKDKAILRIVGLRDSLFILKEEGIYRLTGDDPTNFTVSLFDNSATILAPDTACVLNNQIYCLSTQGVISINETGVGVVSRPIEDKFLRITSPAFVNYKTQSFAFSYESDRSFLIFVPKTPTDTYATTAFRYNTFTQSWTEWDKAATCGVVETSENRLYTGAGDIKAVEIERKDLTSRDYADRQYNRSINVFDSGYIYMDNTTIIEAGDMITQTQYLTLDQCNSLLAKLKLDPTINVVYDAIKPGDDLSLWMNGLYAELNLKDASRVTVAFDPSTAFDSLSDKITINAHPFIAGDVVRFDVALLGLDVNTDYYVVNPTVNDFQIALSNGTPLALQNQVITSANISNNYVSTKTSFIDLQTEFNANIDRLNNSPNLFFTDYAYSTGNIYYDLLVIKVEQNQTRILVKNISPFFIGPAIHYKAIKSSIVWNFQDFGEPSISKHVREGVTLIESTSLSSATVGYATDLSGNFEDITFSLDGDGGWGDSIYQNVAWGGTGIAVPMRTLIPRQKQRCRYIKARFKHINAFYKFSILGIAYTFETTSERAWR